MLHPVARERASSRPISNVRLAALPPQDLDDIVHSAPSAAFARGSVVHDSSDQSEVYFVEAGLVGLHVAVGNGRCVEAVALGRDAIVGADALFGVRLGVSSRTVAYTPVVARALPMKVVVDLVDASAEFRREVLSALGDIHAGALRRVACARFHTVNERVARWLLIARAEIGDSIAVPHAVIGDALGCRRSGATVAMQELKALGIVTYSRGDVRILDPLALARRACDCGPAAPAAVQDRYSAAPQ